MHDDDDTEAKTVFPDIIVYNRGTKENHFVIEVKKSPNSASRDADYAKLRGYKRTLGFQFALLIELGTLHQATVIAVKWLQALCSAAIASSNAHQFTDAALGGACHPGTASTVRCFTSAWGGRRTGPGHGFPPKLRRDAPATFARTAQRTLQRTGWSALGAARQRTAAEPTGYGQSASVPRLAKT